MKLFLVLLIGCSIVASSLAAGAKATNKDKDPAKVDLIGMFAGGEGNRNLINLALMLTVLTFAPAILLLMTSFTRIVIVLSFLRQAIGMPTLPPTQVIVGLSLFLTFFVMGPTFERVHTNALSPYMNNKIGYDEFIDKSSKEMGTFMFKFARDKDIALFANMAGLQRPKNEGDIPFRVLVPAFAISELKRAFQIGFLLLHTVLDNRSGRGERASVHRHDDAATYFHISAIQADALCSGGWLEFAGGITRQELPLGGQL